LIEDAYTLGKQLGLEVWCQDEAGPFQTVPQPGPSWQPEGKPAQQPHEYFRQGTAKVLTLFHPRTGEVRVHGVTSCTNKVLHGWLQQELAEIVAALPNVPPTAAASREAWERWLQGLQKPLVLPGELPPLRLLLVLDNLAGHKTPAFVVWLLMQGILPLYTPLGGSWLNMAESIQRILKRHRVGRPTPANPGRDHGLVGGGGRTLEQGSNPVCVGRETSPAARTPAGTPPSTGWLRCLQPQASPKTQTTQLWLHTWQVTH
jgi:hypothetical protein